MTDLQKLDSKNIWHPFTPLSGSENPLLITSASGVYLYTQDGQKIIDAVSSWWVNLHGHSHPFIADAIGQQARQLEHVIFAGFTHTPAIQLSKNLLSILPANQEKIFFSDDGSTAVEVAVKMALQYWHNIKKPKKKIVAIAGAYHGDTFGSMSVGARSLFTDPFSTHLFDVDFLSFPEGKNNTKVIDEFRELIERGQTAAFIFEPLIQGAAGMRMFEPRVLDDLISIAKENKVITIADEVFTGFGRTGKLFACDHLNNQPDIIALSKGLTGGTLPMGITSCASWIVKAFESNDFSKTFFHGHSYTANPVACAAANASFELLLHEDCKKQIKLISEWHRNFVDEVKHHDAVREARSLGTVMAIEIKTDEGSEYTNTLRKKIYPFFLERGILLRPLGNIIYMVPPYVITQSELTIVYKAIREFLDNVSIEG